MLILLSQSPSASALATLKVSAMGETPWLLLSLVLSRALTLLRLPPSLETLAPSALFPLSSFLPSHDSATFFLTSVVPSLMVVFSSAFVWFSAPRRKEGRREWQRESSSNLLGFFDVWLMRDEWRRTRAEGRRKTS